MHETVIANMVLKDLEKYKDIESASIEVGELAEITADELEEAMKNMVDYEVSVAETPAKVKCGCGHEGRPEIIERGHHFVAFVCKNCGQVPEIVEGNEIRIKDVEVKSQLEG
ncbi:MAG: hydrogenase/urease maturation nickel metallochaperone HypA [Candidatus Woesearchaeota archaeon]